MPHILIIEDDPSIRSILSELLTDAGYKTTPCDNGAQGVSMFKNGAFDLVLLDIMLPNMDGFQVCKTIREYSTAPVIMLTALDEEQAQVKAFELKADDYITKPFSLKLVLMRVEAVLRRSGSNEKSVLVLVKGDIRLETENMRVYKGSEEIPLTKTEYELLKLFMENKERVFTRENLLNRAWGYDFFGDEKTVNIHIMNIRRKLGAELIETVRGVGYRLGKN